MSDTLKGWTITNIHAGRNGHGNHIYAELHNENGELEIGGTLDYITDYVREISAGLWTISPTT